MRTEISPSTMERSLTEIIIIVVKGDHMYKAIGPHAIREELSNQNKKW